MPQAHLPCRASPTTLHDEEPHFQPDPQLDRALELFYTDGGAWDRLPAQLRSQTGIYEDLRESYRVAVKAGVVKG